jgi:hypothetical protein
MLFCVSPFRLEIRQEYQLITSTLTALSSGMKEEKYSFKITYSAKRKKATPSSRQCNVHIKTTKQSKNKDYL